MEGEQRPLCHHLPLCLLEPLPNALGASELFSLQLREFPEKPFPTAAASTLPSRAPLATATSGLQSTGLAHPSLEDPLLGPPSLGRGACSLMSQWHHHPTPQAAQSSDQQLATSSLRHEATERHSPSPASRRGSAGGCSSTLCSQSKSWHFPHHKLLSAGLMSLPSGELGAP